MTRFATALAALSLAVAPSSAAHVFRVLQGAEAEGGDSADAGPTINVPDYSDDLCRTWLDGFLEADEDGSGGLTGDEFQDFLKGVDDPPYVSEFFDKSDSYLGLPWLLKVAYNSLACRCQALGGGEGCCAGPGAEIPLVGLAGDDDADATEREAGLTEEQRKAAAQFRADVCDSVAAAFEKAVPAPEPTAAPVTGAPVAEVPAPAPCGTEGEPPCPGGVAVVEGPGLDVVGSVLDYSVVDYEEILNNLPLEDPEYGAQKVMTNEDGNDILSHVIKGFGALSNKGVQRNLRGGRDLQSVELQPVLVSDIPCPAGLVYAPEGVYCLNFAFRFKSLAGSEDVMSAFIDRLADAVNDGKLYDAIVDEHSDTLVKGMGNPGRGVDYRTGQVGGGVITSDVSVPPDVTVAAATGADDDEEGDSGGLSTGLIVLIIICVIAVPMALLALYAKSQKSQARERMERLAEYEAKRDLESKKNRGLPQDDDRSAASGEFVDLADDDGPSAPRVSAGSSLAAMGAAGAAATIPKREDKGDDKSKIRASVEKLVDETNAPKTADELLATYAGREDELVAHLSTMKKRQDTNDEILSLVDKTKPPKSADELLAAYAGREEDLLRNLRTMNEKMEQKAEIARIVEEVKPGKTAEELLSAYSGREDELLKNLKRMQSGRVQAAKSEETKASIRSLVDETSPGKTADELLATYEGREDDLLKNLEKLKSKNELEASQKDQVKALVEETKPGKTAEELLAAYGGREDELIQNLEKMKAKKEMTASQRDSVCKLVDETKPGKTADELLAAYSGREDELIKNLEKMKAKQERESVKESKAASVRQLVDETNPGKSAEELLALYDGKEDELIKNLEKMKAKQAKQALQKKEDEEAKVEAEQETQTAQKEIETSALASKKESVRNLVDETNPGKTADELLAMYEGKEDELIKNLEKMKAKQEKMAVKNRELKAEKQKSIRALVEETIPGKSAEELLEMYDGKEDQLMKNLEKMKSKQKIQDTANKQQSIRQLVDETNPGKTADELLSMYVGKEDELIKNLEKMKAKQSKKAANELEEKELQVSKIKSLVDETKPGKSAEELLAAYDGKEEELLKNLTKMKSKQEAKAKKEKREQVRLLVDQTNPGKTADELLAAYEGKEDELIKNLTKMKSKQELKKAKSAKKETPAAPINKGDDKDATKSLVASLVAETNPGKSADDLLAAYAGREEELVAHLKKLKASKRKVV